MGAKIEAIRRLISGGGTADYVRGMATLVLRSFGVSTAKYEKCVQRAYDRLAVEAPGRLFGGALSPEGLSRIMKLPDARMPG